MNCKRIIAVVLSCMMLFTLVPFAYAEEHEHDWVITIMREATCEDRGIVKKTCDC